MDSLVEPDKPSDGEATSPFALGQKRLNLFIRYAARGSHKGFAETISLGRYAPSKKFKVEWSHERFADRPKLRCFGFCHAEAPKLECSPLGCKGQA